MRKDAGFEVTDRIEIAFESGDEVAQALETYEEMVCRTTLAVRIARGAAPEGWFARDWDINGKKASLAVTKA